MCAQLVAQCSPVHVRARTYVRHIITSKKDFAEIPHVGQSVDWSRVELSRAITERNDMDEAFISYRILRNRKIELNVLYSMVLRRTANSRSLHLYSCMGQKQFKTNNKQQNCN